MLAKEKITGRKVLPTLNWQTETSLIIFGEFNVRQCNDNHKFHDYSQKIIKMSTMKKHQDMKQTIGMSFLGNWGELSLTSVTMITTDTACGVLEPSPELSNTITTVISYRSRD